MNNSNVKKREKVLEGLGKFLPPGFDSLITDLFFSTPIRFKIVAPRKTKLGDFRAGSQNKKPQITINGDLNPYSFLITTLHEFAHLHTYQQHGRKVNPHGEEWKNNFKKLLIPIIDTGKLPKDIENALLNSLINLKASSCTDLPLARILKNYDISKTGFNILEEIPKNSIFALHGRKFKKGEFRRKRFVCEEINSKRLFLISCLAEVVLLEP